MASPPPRKESKIQWLKVPRRAFNRARNAISPNSRPHSPVEPALPKTSTSQRSSALLATDSANRVAGAEGNRSQDTASQTNTSEKIKKAWGVTRSGLMTALRILEKSADAFPPLKSAVGGLVACLDLAQVSHGCVFNTLCF